jgi:hypothetical protein
MTKEELIEFLMENLRIDIAYRSGDDYTPNRITVGLFLDGDEICTSTDSMF